MADVDPTPETIAQITTGLVIYLAAPGYGEMFAEAGFGNLVDLARSGAPPRDVFAAVPVELLESVGLIGSANDVRHRVDDYVAAGVDEICVVPATAGDAATRTLRTLAPR